MKKTGIINSEVSAVVANMGHMDWLSIGDAGMPVSFGPNIVAYVSQLVSRKLKPIAIAKIATKNIL